MKKHTNTLLHPITADLKGQILALSKVIPEEVLQPKFALWLSFVLHVGFEAGLRRGEINGARPDWFDLEQGCITIPPHSLRRSTKRTRTIPMTEALFLFLLTYPMAGKWCVGPDSVKRELFWRYDYTSSLTLFMQWAGTKVGCDLSKVRSLTMRPTFAALLLEAKTPVVQVAQWLGCPEELVRKHYRIRSKK